MTGKHIFTLLGAAWLAITAGRAEDTLSRFGSFGPLFDVFPLTLSSGQRIEAMGPLFYREENEDQRQWALPPLFSNTTDESLELQETDVLYPLLTYDQFGAEFRLQLIQLLSFSGGQTQSGDGTKRFTLFPIYFQQRSPDPQRNYTALVPIYGELKNRLFRDEIRFILFPLYSQTRKKDVITDNYLYPVVHMRRGDGVDLSGWQVWPLVGSETRHPLTRTNRYDEVETLGGHEKFFALWPIFLKETTGIGTDNPQRQLSVLPLFSKTRSPQRDSITAPWPIGLTLTEDREKKYREVGAPWPLVVFARGEGKTVSRVWPLLSQASNAHLQSDFYLWPIYKYNRLQSDPLDRERTRILLFLYSDISERNTQTGHAKQRRDFWPFFTWKRDLDGRERLQILAPIEPMLPNNKSIERNYSPLWSFWRSEKNPQTHASSQSLLWNLYRRDKTDDATHGSALFGLFQYRRDGDGKSWRLFYLPVGKDKRSSSLSKSNKNSCSVASAKGAEALVAR